MSRTLLWTIMDFNKKGPINTIFDLRNDRYHLYVVQFDCYENSYVSIVANQQQTRTIGVWSVSV